MSWLAYSSSNISLLLVSSLAHYSGVQEEFYDLLSGDILSLQIQKWRYKTLGGDILSKEFSYLSLLFSNCPSMVLLVFSPHSRISFSLIEWYFLSQLN